MTAYVLLLANAPEEWDAGPASSPQEDQVIADWGDYTRALHDAGVLVDGAALHNIDSATSVRIRGGKLMVTDGPFADTKEHLIGYYIIDVPDLDTALEWAARVPNVRTGTVEVRPLREGSNTSVMLGLATAALTTTAGNDRHG
jgi:hypothetical protein